VLAADEDKAALAELGAVLERLGHDVVSFAVSPAEARAVIAAENPDAALVRLHHDDEHALELIGEIAEFARGPVIAILEKEDPQFVAEAAKRGISAYAREGRAESIQAAIEVATRRYREHRELAEQVERLEGALQRRALIERAKGILMERHSIADRAAFELLREHARSNNRTVVDVAAAVTEGHALLRQARE
jgi:response regulator NasT